MSHPDHDTTDSHGLVEKLQLIAPGSDTFNVYGGDDVVERARAWALQNRLFLARGIPKCAHGLYLMSSCPTHEAGCGAGSSALDHANIWVPQIAWGDDMIARPFLLCFPYLKDPGPLRAYAAAHGLGLTWTSRTRGAGERPADMLWDRQALWYGSGAIAVQLSIEGSWPMWPIERLAALVQLTQPTTWPDK